MERIINKGANMEARDLVYVQSLQQAVYQWRARNRWADGISFDSFPERYRAELELAAFIRVNMR